MKSLTICGLLLAISYLACHQKETTSPLKNPGTADIQTTKATSSDSFYIYKVINNLGDNHINIGIKVHLTDEDVEKVEAIVEPTLLNNDKDNLVIKIQKENLSGLNNITLYDSLYFHNYMKKGKKLHVKHFEYHVTPTDAYLLAIYKNPGPGRLVYASDLDSLEIKCILHKTDDIPADVISLQPKKSEIQYFECEDKSYRFVSFYTDSKSDLYFYKYKNTTELVYTASGSNIVVDITILPVFIRDKPILFVSLGDSEEDYIEEKLMIFNGRQYEIMKGNRINKNK